MADYESRADHMEQPSCDKRLYKYIELSNGLCALLVQDSPLKRAVAAMLVTLGSFSDPPQFPGLAHLLEHMLFKGSEGFPGQNEYEEYLGKHGGSNNAVTGHEHTCYYFKVNNDGLHDALKRFSGSFVSPLFNDGPLQKEIPAMHSEFEKYLQHDYACLNQLRCHTSSPGHPFNKFMWGNKESPKDGLEKKECLIKHIQELHSANYHGRSMKLIVIDLSYGNDLSTALVSLQVLEKWVHNFFGCVKFKKEDLVNPDERTITPVWKVGKLYRLEAVTDVHNLILSWTLPSLRKDYLKKGDEYLAYILGHDKKEKTHCFSS